MPLLRIALLQSSLPEAGQAMEKGPLRKGFVADNGTGRRATDDDDETNKEEANQQVAGRFIGVGKINRPS